MLINQYNTCVLHVQSGQKDFFCIANLLPVTSIMFTTTSAYTLAIYN